MSVDALEKIYTREWFEHDFAELRPEFYVAASGIMRQFQPRSVVDLGCGPGMMLEFLHMRGAEVWGFDGSRHSRVMASDEIARRIAIVDLVELKGPELDALAPSVILCTEVAEHLDEKDAPKLVELLAWPHCPVIFTAAPPGQDGHHHVNCQPAEYWLKLFAERAMLIDTKATLELQRRWGSLQRLSHMTRNVMVLR